MSVVVDQKRAVVLPYLKARSRSGNCRLLLLDERRLSAQTGSVGLDQQWAGKRQEPDLQATAIGLPRLRRVSVAGP